MINEKILNILSEKPCAYYTEKVFKRIFPKEYNEILKIKFPENFRFTQKLYHYIYDDNELKLGFCKFCNLNRCYFLSLFQGYRDYCCNKCAQSSPEIQQKVKDTLYNNYGVTIPLHSEEIKQKSIETCRKKYGVDYYSQTEECNLKIEETCRNKYGVKRVSSTQEWKDKLANLSYKKWGVKSFLQTQEFQEKSIETCQKKYGVDNYTQTNEYKIKSYNSKKKNNSFHTSKIEEELYSWFIENKIHVLRQYKSDLYPFACDFYLPDYDLYIELQGHWGHGHHPFDENNPEDIKILNEWKSKNTKYYNNAIKVWTEKDVLKRNIAKENNLNYLEIFSNDLSEITNIIHKYLYMTF